MKKLPVLLFVTLFAALSFRPADPLPIGAPIPLADVKLTDVSGKQITLKESISENGLLVMFSCNTCPVVIENQARTLETGKYAIANKIGMVVLNSNEGSRRKSESPEAMKEYAQEQRYTFSYAIDKNSALADAFGANRTPECFLFDKNGKLVYHGAIDDNPQDEGDVKRQHLKLAIDELASGKEISVKKTKSVGCNIKRG